MNARCHARTITAAALTAVATVGALLATGATASAQDRPDDRLARPGAGMPGSMTQQGAGMSGMPQRISDGNRGMARMHELMVEGNPGMARMHQLMTDGSR